MVTLRRSLCDHEAEKAVARSSFSFLFFFLKSFLFVAVGHVRMVTNSGVEKGGAWDGGGLRKDHRFHGLICVAGKRARSQIAGWVVTSPMGKAMERSQISRSKATSFGV